MVGLRSNDRMGSHLYRFPSHHQYEIDGAAERREDVHVRPARRKLRDMQGKVRVMLFLGGGAELVQLPLSSPHHAAIGHAGLIASTASGRVV